MSPSHAVRPAVSRLRRTLIGVTVAGLVALVGLGATVVVKRSAAYHFDVRADQTFTFGSDVTRIPVEVKDGSLLVPGGVTAGATVMLKLAVAPSLSGYWFAPRIVSSDGVHRNLQTIERGGAGIRWINLSGLAMAADTKIHLEAQHLRLPDQQASLYIFRNPWHTGQERVLVISPHPDDAEIAAFGLYSQSDAYVVTVTAGEAGEAGPFARFGDRQTQHLYKGLERSWNSATVPMLGNVSIMRTANLGYFDGTLTAMHNAQGGPVRSRDTGLATIDSFRYAASPNFIPDRRSAPATWPSLVGDLAYLIDEIRPDVIVTVFPALDGHPDHKMCTVAVIDALKQTAFRPGHLLLYTNHLPASYMYPFGPIGSTISLPPVRLDVEIDGILSVPLSKLTQARKFMALEAMVDVRPSDNQGSVVAAVRRLYESTRGRLDDSDGNYERRADRANELFFVVDTTHLDDARWVAGIIGATP